MTITILIDNSLGKDATLATEHGLSMLIETDERQHILCDMGASGKFIENATLLGISLNSVDIAFISHGHNDHTGGLKDFTEKHPQHTVWLSSHIPHTKYYSSRHDNKRDISTDQTLFETHTNRFNFISTSQWIAPNIAIVTNKHHLFAKPIGNKFLSKEEKGSPIVADDFNHELSLAIVSKKGLIIISSCSHEGAINIIKSCCQFTGESRVDSFIGGLHIVDGENVATETYILLNELKLHYPNTRIFTGHCTCNTAKEILSSNNSNIHLFHTGDIICI